VRFGPALTGPDENKFGGGGDLPNSDGDDTERLPNTILNSLLLVELKSPGYLKVCELKSIKRE
jgi:hypothetical protein